LYALTVLHLPSYSSEKWNHDFLKVFLVELGLSENLYEAFYPLSERSSGVDDILSTVTTDSASEAFLTIIDTAGLDRIDLFIGILVYLRFRYQSVFLYCPSNFCRRSTAVEVEFNVLQMSSSHVL
jgi:hypothetical protein